MKDLCYIDQTTNAVVPIPFEITGECEGRVLLAQRVITMLLGNTEDPARTLATGVAQDVGSSNVRNSEELSSDFTFALTTIQNLLVAEQDARDDLDDSETLSELILEDLQSDTDTVSATIDIVTVDGETLRTSFEI